MKKLAAVALASIMLLAGCSQSPKTQVEPPPATPLPSTTWSEFDSSEPTDKRYALEDMRKVEFAYVSGLIQNTEFQADLMAKTLRYVENDEPIYGTKEECSLSDDQIQALLAILQEEKVQDWKAEYEGADKMADDVFSWSLIMETPYLTQERHDGVGYEGGAPENYKQVEQKLDQFALDCSQGSH